MEYGLQYSRAFPPFAWQVRPECTGKKTVGCVRNGDPRTDCKERRSDLKVWLGLRVWVVFDRLADPLGDRVFVDRHLPLANAYSKLVEMVMNICDH